MIMKNTNIKTSRTSLVPRLAVVVTLCLGLASCKGFLDQVPDLRTEIDNEDNIVKLIAGSYPETNYQWLAELSGDNLLDNQCPHMPSNPNDKQILAHYNYGSYYRWHDQMYRFEAATEATLSDWDSPGFVWENYYKAIGSCNAALEAINNLGATSERLRAAHAEALIIRAYSHFILVNLFGNAYKNPRVSANEQGIPYVTVPETDLFKKYPRLSVKEVYDNIQADLEAALPDINDAYYHAPKYRFNKSAAHAFAARFYLYKREYAKVIEHANAVLGEGTDNLSNMLMQYSGFTECSTLNDYMNVWQSPEQNNNIMLLSTVSLMERFVFGYRYSIAGPKCQEAMLVTTKCPLWSGYICPPLAVVGGMLFGSSTKDYGFFNSKIGEQFQYSDKLAGIGTPHIIVRAFTCNNLLLERAEAELALGMIEEGKADIMAYWDVSNESLSEKDKLSMSRYIKPFDERFFDTYFAKSTNANCFDNWDFTKEIAPDFVIAPENVKYWNALNTFRRFENTFEGLRFFDIKRWGIPYKHEYSTESLVYPMPTNDYRLALDVPWETMAAGLESSRIIPASTTELTMDKESFRTKE